MTRREDAEKIVEEFLDESEVPGLKDCTDYFVPCVEIVEWLLEKGRISNG